HHVFPSELARPGSRDFFSGRFFLLVEKRQEATILQLPDCIQEEYSQQREKNKAHEQTVYRGNRAGSEDPNNSRNRDKTKSDGNQECRGTQETPFSHLDFIA